MSFKDALEIEDVDSNGYLSIDHFKLVVKQMDLTLKKVHVDYLIYEMYKVSKNSQKLKYSQIFKLFGDKSEKNIKSEGKQIEEDNDEQYEDEFSPLSKKTLSNNQQTHDREEAKDTAHDIHPNETDPEFTDTQLTKFKHQTLAQTPKDAIDQTITETQNLDTQLNFDTEQEKQQTNRSTPSNEGENEDDYINDEEMIRIAETCLVRISDALNRQNLSIHQLFAHNIMTETIEGQKIELLAPIHFIEGLKDLGITDFGELEIACLVNLLTRPELDDLILVEELNILKDNTKIRESVTEMLEKTGNSPYKSDDGAHSGEKRRRGINFAKVGDRSVCVIFLLTEYLLRNNMSLFTLYDGKIYDQLVKTKTKESVVEIINANDFFGILKSGIVSDAYLSTIDDTKQLIEEGDVHQSVQEDLQSLLCLDPNYKDLLLIKKVTKFIDELTMREDLREQALRVLPDDIDFGDIDEEDNAYNDQSAPQEIYNAKNKFLKEPMMGKGRNMLKNPYPGGERLNTIEEEEKQFETQSNIYRTNDKHPGHSNTPLGYVKNRNSTFSKGVLSDAAAKNYTDSRRRLDDDDDDSAAFDRSYNRKVKSYNDSIDEELQDEYPDDFGN